MWCLGWLFDVSCYQDRDCVKPWVAIRVRIDTAEARKLDRRDPSLLQQLSLGGFSEGFSPLDRSPGQCPLAGIPALDEKESSVRGRGNDRNSDNRTPQKVTENLLDDTKKAYGNFQHGRTMPHIVAAEKSPRQLHRGSSIDSPVTPSNRAASWKHLKRRQHETSVLGVIVWTLCACEPSLLPGEEPHEVNSVLVASVGPSSSSPILVPDDADAGASLGDRLGTMDDNLPFEPTETKLASIAWRTWIYTDTGPKRTRLGYLRAGQVVDARGPEIVNDGCAGGWWRINPRGFVCVGKGATLDVSHPVVVALGVRPKRGHGFPYHYAKSKDRAPERYFRLPTKDQMIEVEGYEVLDRGPAFRQRAEQSGFLDLFNIQAEPPEFLEGGTALLKPYGAKTHLRRQVHAGRASSDSGFALLQSFFHEGRAFGLSSELDLLALDRLELVRPPEDFSVMLSDEMSLPVAFHVTGSNTLWRRNEQGRFIAEAEQRDRKGFGLTGQRMHGMIETTEGVWLAESTVRVIELRDGFPSVATGRRKWIDISIRDQALVAYEGQRPVFVTLISSGRGGLGERDESNPDGEKTVRGTFMIHEKSVSSTMDGDEDRADSYELQDVPMVQYFHRGFALHGAYWHDDFGKKRSHGCINLAPHDAAWLFEWTDPAVPEGWHAALNKQRGTVVHVRY